MLIRESRWGQDTPMDQLRTLLGAIQGEALNQIEEIAGPLACKRILQMVVDAQTIVNAIAEGQDPHKW